jgi:hypothetical protein
MYLHDCFPGDDYEYLKRLQHDMYWHLNNLQYDIPFNQLIKHSFDFHGIEYPSKELYSGEYDFKLRAIDHRRLQLTHDLIAAQYRFYHGVRPNEKEEVLTYLIDDEKPVFNHDKHTVNLHALRWRAYFVECVNGFFKIWNYHDPEPYRKFRCVFDVVNSEWPNEEAKTEFYKYWVEFLISKHRIRNEADVNEGTNELYPKQLHLPTLYVSKKYLDVPVSGPRFTISG